MARPVGGGEKSALVGRDSELGLISEAVAEGRRGPVAIALSGEPGIGKTRLLRELIERASDGGALVFDGRAAEFEQSTPFAVLSDAIERRLDELNPRLLEGLTDESRAELGRAFPALARGASAGASSLQDERHHLHVAFRSLLERLGAWKPVVLALDDLHWADDASLELISFLVRRPAAAPVTIALAFRPAQAPALLRAALRDARRADGVRAVDLRPLSEAEAYSLLEGIGDEARRELYRESGGNPFYLEQLARLASKPASGRSPALAAETRIEGVPRTVVAAIQAESELLDENARRLAEGAAVIGERFGLDLAVAAAGIDPGSAAAAVDALVSASLAVPTSEPRQFRFRHPIVRRAIYEATPPGWRLEAHRRAAQALADAGAAPGALARHIEASASPGDEDAIAALRAAADEAFSRAPAAAAHWHAAALRLMAADDPRRLELLVAMATALGSAGRLAESRDALRTVLSELPPELEALRVQVIPFIAFIEHLLGNHDAAREALNRALDSVPEGATRDLAALRLELAADHFYTNDDALAERAAEAVEAARAADDALLLAEANALLALGDYKVGRIESADAHYLEAAAAVDAREDHELAERLVVLFWLGWYGQCGERHEAGVRHMDRAIAISRLTGQGHLLVPIMVGKAICMTALGRLEGAAEIADETIEMARLAVNDQSLAWGLTLRCWIAATAGEIPLAIRCGEEAVRAVERFSDSYFSRLAGCYLGEALVESGEPQRAKDAILVATGPELEPLEAAYRPHFYEVLTRAELALGEVGSAREWAELAAADVSGMPLAGRTGEALRAQAAVELAEGDFLAAAQTALEAADSFASCAQRVDAARARLIAGRALSRADRAEDAVDQLETARRELVACGASRHADAAARELRRLGLRVARAGVKGTADAGVESLSGREHEIAQLVVGGRTNRQIAAELHLSEKTVETHVSRIFRKLGISRRAQLGSVIGGASGG